jgi:TRAP-type C4-dicarboxylate transport system permease small subunit
MVDFILTFLGDKGEKALSIIANVVIIVSLGTLMAPPS